MKIRKLLSVLSTLAILAGVLAVCPVLPAAAETTTEFTISDNGVYKMDEVLTEAPLTLEAEIKFPVAGVTRSGILLGNWCYPTTAFMDYYITADGAPQLYWGLSGSSSERLTFTDVDVFTGEWLHLAIVIDVANAQVHCYINGELKQSLTTEYTSTFVCANEFAVGNNIRQGNGYNFRGALRSLALYNDVRTASEITADVTAYGTDGLMIHYDMEGLTEGDTLTDAVSENNASWEQKWLDTKDPVGDYDYSIAVIGDPQTVTKSYPESLPKIYQHIADTAEEKKLAHVFTMGDLTDTTTGVEKEWVAITGAMDLLNGVVPHSMLRGNHDNETFYDRYITAERYNDGVTTMDTTMKNYYREIAVDGTDYLMVTLDWRPDVAEQEWACEVIEAHPDHRVILTTHSFTDSTGDINNAGVEGDGVDIWNRIASKYPNIVLVLSGHSASEDIVMRTATGDNGNTVTHILVDQQDADQPIEGGTGLIAYLYFSNNGENVEVEFYSPLRDQYYKPNNQFSFELDIPWDKTIPALKAAASDYQKETSYDFSVTGISEYAGGNYIASGTYYYKFPATDTAVMDYLDSKLNFYYSREGVVYTQRDPVTNGADSDGETRWILIWNSMLERSTPKTDGEKFRKIDSLVPKNSLGQEIRLKNFETTFKARLEYEDYGAIILGFRQQTPGRFVTGWYKFDKSQCFVAIGMKGITLTGGADIVALHGGTGETDNYNHFETSFDDPDTEEVEKLTKDITVSVRVVDTLCKVSVTDANGKTYTFEETVPYTASGTLAYAVSTVKGNIGNITLKGLDDAGNAIDLAMPGSENDASILRFYGGDVAVDAAATDSGYLYTLHVQPLDGYALDASAFYVVDGDGNTLTPVRAAENVYYVQTNGGGTVYAAFAAQTDTAADTVERFEADFSELSALVPAETYTDGVYTSGSDTTGENATDTAVNEWVSKKFGLHFNQEQSIYYEMAYLGQPSEDLKAGDGGYTGNMQWQIGENGAINMTVANKSGQLLRKSMTLTAKDANGEYIEVSNFEAEVVFNKAGKNAKLGGVYVSFHEKSPGRVNFNNSSPYAPMSTMGDLMVVGNAPATYSYQSYSNNISVMSGMYDLATSRAAEEVLNEAWGTTDEYKLHVKVVDTVLTWSLTNLTDGRLIATGTDEITAGSGTVSVGVASGEHELKSFTVTELDTYGNAVDLGYFDPFSWTVAGLIPYSGNKYTVNSKGYYTFAGQTTDEANTIIAALENNFDTYYNQQNEYFEVTHGERGNDLNDETGATIDVAGFDVIYANAWLQRNVSSILGNNSENMRLISSLVPKKNGTAMQFKNFETTVEVDFETNNNPCAAFVFGFRQQTPGKFVNGWKNINQEQGLIVLTNTGISIGAGESITTDFYNTDSISFETATSRYVRVYIKVVENAVMVKVTNFDDSSIVYYDNSASPAVIDYDTAGYVAYGISDRKGNLGNISLQPLSEQPENTAAVDETTGIISVKAADGYELRAGSLVVTDVNGVKYIPQRVNFREEGDALLYEVIDEGFDPVGASVSYFFMKSSLNVPNIGNVGNSYNSSLNGLRFVSRFTREVDGGTEYVVTADGKKYAISDYGMLITSKPGLDANTGLTAEQALSLNAEMAPAGQYVQKLSIVEENKFYDVCNDHIDMAVTLINIDKVTGYGAYKDIQFYARAYVVVTVDGAQQVLYGNAFNASYGDVASVR